VGRRARFSYRFEVRYLEVDQQSVVFHMWYLAYLDDAMTAYLDGGGLAYTDMTDAGFDVQLVHTELDWSGSLRWGSRPSIEVETASVGRTSFSLRFAVHDGPDLVCRARTVYVAMTTDGAGKIPIPEDLRRALGEPVPETDGS
jgi:acyl-CoA thioester hydrolase